MNDERVIEQNLLRRGTIGDGFRRSASRLPNKPHLIYYDHNNERSVYSYKDVNKNANKIANALYKEYGVKKGDKVAIMSHNIPQFIMIWSGLTKIGAVITGVNFSYKKDEVQYQINHSEPKVFFVEDTLIENIEPIKTNLISVKHFIGINLQKKDLPPGWIKFDELTSEKYQITEPEIEIDDTDIAMLSYTSGTEARPKGVMLQYRNYLSSTIPSWIKDVRMEEEDIFLYYMPFYTIAGLGSITTCSMLGTTMILSYNVIPEKALQIIDYENATLIGQTPAFYMKLAQSEEFHKHSLQSLKKCIVYGGLIPRKMVEDWHKKVPKMLWGTYWGQSELSQLGSAGWFSEIKDIPDEDPSWIGKPVFTLETKVIDESGKEIEEGVGELLCRGSCVMVGYFKDEKKTKEVMRDGWVHTGDIVRVDKSKNMFFFDRSKDVIKTGGMNVSSFEVQDAINRHPKVLEVAVIGLKDDYWSEKVAAFIVILKGETVEREEIILFCKKSLAAYKVPKEIYFVDELPHDRQGKLLKRKLKEVYDK